MRVRLTEMVRGNELGLWTSDIPSAEPAVDPPQLAATVRVPTLTAVGRLDLPGFVDVSSWLAANMAGATQSSAVLVGGSGHMLPMEAPVAFNGILGRFLAENTTRPDAGPGWAPWHWPARAALPRLNSYRRPASRGSEPLD